jgi:amino acid adenylation domain-containing protein
MPVDNTGLTGHRLVPELFTAQAARTPGALAVRQWESRLSYAELLGQAAGLAARLRHRGIGAESRVGICVRRTPDLVAAVLGVLLAGAAYVPLDPAHPVRRLRAILDDSGAVAAVADPAGQELLGMPTVAVRDERTAPAAPVAAVRAGQAAYVMYTSGSTGQPKGVVVSHGSLAAFVTATGERFGLDGNCRGIGFASVGFDVSILDILVPLCRGGSVQLIGEADRSDPARLQRFLEEHRVTWGVLPPAVLPLLAPDRLPGLTELLTAGEPPEPGQVARWSGPCRRFHNWYGPTETTVCVTGTELNGTWDRPLPIGRPLGDCTAYVLGSRLEPCPPGVPGELCIGGPQLARGYAGQPGQTAQRFIADPFGGQPGARLYRTGDLAAWQQDGNLAFLGRLDRQVKIHGQRVEAGEVEAVLSGHPGVRQAVVDAEPAPAGHLRLAAYLVPAGPGLAGLRDYCASRLPAAMVPARFVTVASLPLTVSGKADIAALRAVAAAGDDDAPAPPAGGPVAALWARLLGAGPDADFFAAGGDSLLAMRLVSELAAGTGRQLTVEDVFTARTPTALAARLATAPPAARRAAVTATAPGLSPGQRRLWFVEQLTPGTPVHNIVLAQRLRGPLNVPALTAALRAVATRQEVLRWRIRDTAGIPEVTVAPPSGPEPVTVLSWPERHPTADLSGILDNVRFQRAQSLLASEAAGAFDLATGPPWRATLIRLDAEDHILALTIHHIVFDGWSQHILYRDLATAYRTALDGGAGTSPVRPSFTDYVATLAARQATRAAPDTAWWMEHLSGAPPVLDLPRDRPRPPVQTFHGASSQIELTGPAAGRVRDLAASLGATPFAVLLAGFGQLLRRLTGQHDLLVGTPFADRGDPAFHDVAGFFLHILPLRLRITDEASFASHVLRCRDEIAAAAAHTAAPLDRIVSSASIPRDLARTPLIQVLFNAYDFTAARLDLPGITAEPIQPGLPGSLFDLTLYAGDRGKAIDLRAVYNPDLYDTVRIDALLASFAFLLTGLTAHPDHPAAQASLRPPNTTLPDWDAPLPDWHGPGLLERTSSAIAAHPDAISISGPQGVLTYRDVGTLRDTTAAALHDAGVTPGNTVAVLAARDIHLPAILLGIRTAGAQWAILDPSMPPTALTRQLTALNPQAAITFTHSEALQGFPVIKVSSLLGAGGAHPDCRRSAQPARRPAEWVPRRFSPAYLTLTSGTTGEPTWVETDETPLAHFLDWYAGTFEITHEDRFALLGGLGHDPVLRDMFCPLVAGARLCVPEQDWLRDPARLTGWLRDEEVTVVHLTPQLGRLMTGEGGRAGTLGRLRLVGLGGDQATGADVAALRRLAPAARILNFYGTTETPQVHGWYEAAPGDGALEALPVGWGAEGSQLLVLDGAGRPAGVGELGEVAIRSRYLANGYTDAGLTRRRFADRAGVRLFRTGDLGRYLPSGAVVLAGRRDDQVKIRGFRVELGEVAAALLGCSGVRAAHVIATGAEPGLRAFVVPDGPGVRAGDIAARLRAVLPSYAVPGDVTLVPAMPLTASGKVDRAALERVERQRDRVAGRAPSSPAERLVAGVWREVLGVPRVGVSDNFFEIGGHSLAMAAVAARLSGQLGRPVAVVDLFRYPSVRELAAHLDGQAADPVFERAAHRARRRREGRR